MCINLQTSIVAFLVGEISGFFLIKNNQKHIGIFIMFYTIIQLIEAFMYYYKNNYKLYSKLLSIFLSLQGLVLMLVSEQKYDSIWFIIFTIIAFTNIIYTTSKNFKAPNTNTCNDCLNWDFIGMNNITSKLLFIMYIGIFLWFFTRDTKINIYFGFLLFLTYIFSYYLKNIKNSPSMWCMTSAFVGPIVVMISKLF
jgi:hypothetical protein